MIDEKKMIEELSKNSIFEKITNAEGKNIFEIIEEQSQVGGWIPVSERLPKDCGEDWVLVQIKERDCGFLWIPRVGEERNGKWWLIDDEEPLEDMFEVIAWQPLPEPYKESDKE